MSGRRPRIIEICIIMAIKGIDKFVKNNNLSKQIKDDKIIISNLWEDKTFELIFSKNEKISILKDVFIPKELYGLYKKDCYEFIFQPLPEENNYKNRKFSFSYKGNQYRAYYGEPSKCFQLIAKAFSPKSIEVDESKINYRNIKPFSDYYQQDNLPESQRVLYSQLTPTNFFVEGPIDNLAASDRELLLRHINFYMLYFDRKSPWIVIAENEAPEEFNVPCLSQIDSSFPSEISFTEIDKDLLNILSIARKASTTRLQYLYYFQVLEYAAYYYIEEDFRNKISNILHSPDLLVKTDIYSRRLIDEFQNKYYKDNSDSLRLFNVINKYCEYRKIRYELLSNKDYFTKDICFDGDFVIKKLFKDEAQIQTGLPNTMQDIKSNLEKIRNVLVHIRESHENKVILPTAKNEELIKPYLYLLRRIAEEVAMRYKYLD